MSQIYFNRQDVELIQSESPKSEFLISEVLLAIKENSYMESSEKDLNRCNSNDFQNSSRIIIFYLGYESKKLKKYVMHSPQTKRKCIDLVNLKKINLKK
jgi:hypothetical protein